MKARTSATEKINRRYLLLKAESKKSVEEALIFFLGSLGMSKAAPLFPEVADLKEGEIVLAVNRKELDNVRGAFEIAKTPIEVKKVSGTIKGLGF